MSVRWRTCRKHAPDGQLMTATVKRNGKPIESPRNQMLNSKAVCAGAFIQPTPYADKMTTLATLEPQSAFLFGHHLEVIAMHAIRASDGILHSLSAKKGSVAFRPTPLPSSDLFQRPCRARVPERRWTRYTNRLCWNNKIVPVSRLMSCSAKVPRSVARECPTGTNVLEQLECPAGTQAGFARATARIRGTGRRWQEW
jgi:hypothetical protein